MSDLRAARIESAAGLVGLGAMLATPFAARGGRWRRVLTAVTVGAGFVRTTAIEVRSHGTARGGGVTAATVVLTSLVEQLGVRTGRPFGTYDYTGALRPQLGGVPVIVPLAWAAMTPPAHAAADAAFGRRSNPASRVLAGAAALTAWDLFLDPQMTREGFWRWAPGGGYRGVPLSNFGGWFVTSAALMAIRELGTRRRQVGAAHVATYATVGVMETTAFATFFRDRVVAIVGGVPMLSLAVLAARRQC